MSEVRFRPASREDAPLLLEMARFACSLEDRPLPPHDDPEVLATLPDPVDAALVALDAGGRPIGAAWWYMHDPPLLRAPDGTPLPELAIAVIPGERGRGVGASLVESLAEQMTGRFPALTLNVHLRNPATHLYTRTGFRVAGKGRGWFGVAMIRHLDRTTG